MMKKHCFSFFRRVQRQSHTRQFSILWGMLLVGLLFGWTACSEKDDELEPDEQEVFTEETEPMIRQDSLNIAFMNIVSTLCETDSTFVQEEDHSGNYKPAYGTLLYSVTPTVRYKVAESAEDAKGQFLSAFATAIEFAGAKDDGTTVRIDLGTKGNVEFEPAHAEGKEGILNVDIPQIPDLTQVVWLQSEAWPQNDGNGGTKVGQTFKTPDGRRWVCIQTPESVTGVLVTFDDYPEIQQSWDPACNGQFKYEGWQYAKFFANEKEWKSWLHWYASSEDLITLNRFMYNSIDGSHSKKAEKVFSNPTFMTPERYNAIYGQNRYYCCGDNTWGYTTSNTHKYKVWYYNSFRKTWKEGSEMHPYLFMGNRWYVMNSNWKNSKLKDDRWNSYDCLSVAGHSKVLSLNGGGDYVWVDGVDYDETSTRNYDKIFDHNTYIKVKTYHFNGDFYNTQTETYKNGFEIFDISDEDD